MIEFPLSFVVVAVRFVSLCCGTLKLLPISLGVSSLLLECFCHQLLLKLLADLFNVCCLGTQLVFLFRTFQIAVMALPNVFEIAPTVFFPLIFKTVCFSPTGYLLVVMFADEQMQFS